VDEVPVLWMRYQFCGWGISSVDEVSVLLGLFLQ